MFFTSSLLPAGNESQCAADCGNATMYFGWTSPIGFPGQFGETVSGLWNFPMIWVGPNVLGTDTSDIGAGLFSFAGGRYPTKYITPQLTPGTWRIIAHYWSQPGTSWKYKDGSLVPWSVINSMTDLLLADGMSLVDKDEKLITPIPMLQLSQFGSPANPPSAFQSNLDTSTNVGGVDGCHHLFSQNIGTAAVGNTVDVAWVRGYDIVVPRKVAYLKATPSTRNNDIEGAFPNVDFTAKVVGSTLPGKLLAYSLHGFYLDGCRCGGFLESSYAMGY